MICIMFSLKYKKAKKTFHLGYFSKNSSYNDMNYKEWNLSLT